MDYIRTVTASEYITYGNDDDPMLIEVCFSRNLKNELCADNCEIKSLLAQLQDLHYGYAEWNNCTFCNKAVNQMKRCTIVVFP